MTIGSSAAPLSIEQVAAQFPAPAALTAADAPKPEGITGETAPASPEAIAGQVVPPASKEEKDLAAAPEEAPKADPAAAKFAALSKREKAARDTEQRAGQMLKDAEARIMKMTADAEAKIKAADEREAAFSKVTRPMDLLKAKGFKYEDVTADYLGGYKEPEVDPVDAKLKPLQEQLNKYAELERKFEQREAQIAQDKYEVNTQVVNNTIGKTIESNADRYEYLTKFGTEAVDSVRETMVQYYEQNGAYLTYEQACDRVEEYWEDVTSKLQSAKKLASRFAGKPAESQAKQPQTPPESKSSTPSKTLTQEMSGGGNQPLDINKMSKAEAIKYLTKQLKFID